MATHEHLLARRGRQVFNCSVLRVGGLLHVPVRVRIGNIVLVLREGLRQLVLDRFLVLQEPRLVVSEPGRRVPYSGKRLLRGSGTEQVVRRYWLSRIGRLPSKMPDIRKLWIHRV